jgi:hypothetical protein
MAQIGKWFGEVGLRGMGRKAFLEELSKLSLEHEQGVVKSLLRGTQWTQMESVNHGPDF